MKTRTFIIDDSRDLARLNLLQPCLQFACDLNAAALTMEELVCNLTVDEIQIYVVQGAPTANGTSLDISCRSMSAGTVQKASDVTLSNSDENDGTISASFDGANAPMDFNAPMDLVISSLAWEVMRQLS